MTIWGSKGLTRTAAAPTAATRASSSVSNAPVSSTTAHARQFGSRAHEGGHFEAILPGHAHVGEHDVEALGFQTLNRLQPVADRHHVDALFGEGQFDDALNGDAVVGKQQTVRHGGENIRPLRGSARSPE